MSSERWQHIEALYAAASELDAAERKRFLEERCGDDPALREEVESLLRHGGATHAFFDAPAAELADLHAKRSLVGDSLASSPFTEALGVDGISRASSPNDEHVARFVDEYFAGTERFRVVRRLGAGGMGLVYEVHDNVRGEAVALKTLRRTGAADLYRLKREFRSLADVTHPNLVCLYELFVEEDRCFFTMELVDGVSFVDYARGARLHHSEDHLVAALRQLVDGVSALHRAGKLHRDIKPSNVLVSREGRVVILDFGLIAEMLPHHAGEVSYVSGGTPAYMSPEEASGASPSEASDWYGVGVTLYEALTGTIPFAGSVVEVLRQKRRSDPPAPVEVSADVSVELSTVCMGLLCRDPNQRLAGPEALRRLTHQAGHVALETLSAPARETPFIGRDRPLRHLHDAFGMVLAGGAAAVSVYGPSGIGKSALVGRFFGQVSVRADVVVLSGRCYENESVPYNALDGVVDELSRHLVSMSTRDVEPLVPPDVSALTRVFPVLRQVRAIAEACSREVSIADALDLRRRAFDAVRELMGRLARKLSLVVCIDDLQWADADSIVLLEDLLRPPSSPAMLTVLCFRSEETAAKPFLQTLVERSGLAPWSAVLLEPMTEDEARSLIGGLLPPDSTLTEHDKNRLIGEAAGSTFVLEQLARYAGVTRKEPGQPPTFAQMFAARLAALPSDARHFLETLAISGRPMAPELVCDACGVVRERQSLVTMLRSSRLIRSSGSSARVETYHDQIREVLAARLVPDAVRRIHGQLVRALVDRRSDDCEALFEHYRGAGDLENASTQAGVAAAKASAALAFDRAASFYRAALALMPASAAARAWQEGLASALANGGRPAEAAEAYLDAAAGADHPQRVELQRRGAEQFLIAGDIDHGLDLIRTVFAGLGMTMPRSPRTAFAWLLWRRARLWWRGLRFEPRPVGDIDPDMLLRVDTCWSATTGLMLVDVVGALDFSARHLLMALDAGEPGRVARAMAIESVARGGYATGRSWSARLSRESRILAQRVGTPHAIALSILAEGMSAMTAGEWKNVSTLSEQALTILRGKCVGVNWEVNIAHSLVIWALMFRGELGEVSRRVPPLLANARSSGNWYMATELCTRSNYAWLAADDPDEGERETLASIGRWSHKAVHRQHYSAMVARIQTALYRDNPDEAWNLLTELESILRRTGLRHIQIFRIESRYIRARSALAMAARHGRSRRFLSLARTGSRRIAREGKPWSDPIACLLRAGIAHLEGNSSCAVSCLEDAADRFDRSDMNLYAAVARRRIGALQKDAHGRELQRQADDWMAAQHIKNPAAITRMLAPGFSGIP